MREPADDLAFHDQRVEDVSDVVDGDVFPDLDPAGSRVDLDRRQIADEAEGDGRGHTVLLVGRAEPRRRDDRRFEDAGRHALGEARRVPVRLGGDAAEGEEFFRHADDPRGAVRELDILRRDFPDPRPPPP